MTIRIATRTAYEIARNEWRGAALYTATAALVTATALHPQAVGVTAVVSAGCAVAWRSFRARAGEDNADMQEWWNTRCTRAGIRHPPEILRHARGPGTFTSRVSASSSREAEWFCRDQTTLFVRLPDPEQLTLSQLKERWEKIKQAIGEGCRHVVISEDREHGDRAIVYIHWTGSNLVGHDIRRAEDAEWNDQRVVRGSELGSIPITINGEVVNGESPTMQPRPSQPVELARSAPAYVPNQPETPERGAGRDVRPSDAVTIARRAAWDAALETAEPGEQIDFLVLDTGEMWAPPNANRIINSPDLIMRSTAPSLPLREDDEDDEWEDLNDLDERPQNARHGTPTGTLWEVLAAGGTHSRGWLAGRVGMSPGGVSNALTGWEREGRVVGLDGGWRSTSPSVTTHSATIIGDGKAA